MGTYLLTGGTRGIGQAVAVELARRGHRVLLLVRDAEAGRRVCSALYTEGDVVACDLAEPAQIDAVNIREPIDGLVHIAGVLVARRRPGPGGVSLTWAVNLLGPARLAQRVRPALRTGSTITFVSGEAHRRFPLSVDRFGKSGGLRAAAEVTTAKILWIRAMARAYPQLNISTFCPGRVRTDLHRSLPFGARQLVGWAMATGMAPAVAASPIVDRVLGGCETGSYGVVGAPAYPASHSATRLI